jgi:hypothetical protein
MSFVSFLLFCIATIGLTNIMVHGKILDVIGLRPWLRENMKPEHFQVFECYECSGFWAGLFCGLFLCSHWWMILLCGFAGGVLAQTYDSFRLWLESKIGFELPEKNDA